MRADIRLRNSVPLTTMPPKGRRKGLIASAVASTPLQLPGTPVDGSLPPSGAQTPVPLAPSLAEQFNFLHEPKPFKNPYYTKNINRRAKTLKSVLNAERERERLEREKKRETLLKVQQAQAEGDEAKMEVDGEEKGKKDGEETEAKPSSPTAFEEDEPTCEFDGRLPCYFDETSPA